eukprot:3631439-Prymnesium_polylepis.1
MLAVFDALAAGMLEVLAGSVAQRPEQPHPLLASPPPPCACSQYAGLVLERSRTPHVIGRGEVW